MKAFADGRITGNTIKELTALWKGGSGENAGFLYADKKTKEVNASLCSSCSGTGATVSLNNLKSTYDDVSQKGNILGMWHTHPANNFWASTEIDKEDTENPTYAVPSFQGGALGVIVNRNTITLYPISRTATDYRENTLDEITTPRFSPNYSGLKTNYQGGVFTKNVNSKTDWDE